MQYELIVQVGRQGKTMHNKLQRLNVPRLEKDAQEVFINIPGKNQTTFSNTCRKDFEANLVPKRRQSDAKVTPKSSIT